MHRRLCRRIRTWIGLAVLAAACTSGTATPDTRITTSGAEIAIDPGLGKVFVTIDAGSGWPDVTTALMVVDVRSLRVAMLGDVGGSSRLTVSPARHLVYAYASTSSIIGPEGGVKVVDGRSGAIRSKHSLQATEMLAAADVVLANLSDFETVAVLDGTSLTKRGAIQSDYGIPAGAVDQRRGRLYLIADSGDLAVFDVPSRRRLWNVRLRTQSGQVAVNEETGNVFVAGEGDPFLYAVDPRGRIVWTHVLEDLGDHRLATARNRLFVLDSSGAVAVIDIQSRREVTTVVLPSRTEGVAAGPARKWQGIVADPRTGAAFVLADDGVVFVIDGHAVKGHTAIDVAAAIPKDAQTRAYAREGSS